MSDDDIEWPNTDGEFSEDGLVMKFGGACPVQGYGTLDGRIAYFRARHDSWRLEVYEEGAKADESFRLPMEPAEWSYGGDVFNAGWLRPEETIALLRLALSKYHSRAPACAAGSEKAR